MNQDQNFIIFSDVKRIFFKSKWIITLGAIAFGAFGFYSRTQKPIVYEVKAVFKEAGKSNLNLSGGVFESFLSGFSASAAKQGHVILQSSVILEPVIEKLGLQAEVAVESAFERKKRHFFDALKAERGRSVENQDGFEFADVSYHGERPKDLTLFFTSRETFEVRDHDHHVLSTGMIGKKTEVEDITFTLSKTPKDLKLRWSYPLSISPLFEKVLALGVIFEAKPTLGDASILSLEIEHSDRNFGIRVLNEIMETYKNYLKDESSQIAKEQLSFLTERRDGYMREMEDLLEDHVVYLKEHLNRTGTLNLKEQLSSLENRKGKLLTDLLNIDLSVEDLLETTPSLASHLGPEVDALQRELHTIAKEKDALSLANVGHPRFQFDMAKHLDRLDQIEKEELKVKTGIDTFFSALSDTIRQKDQILLDIGEFTAVLSPDAARLKKVQNQKHNLKELIVEASSKGLSSAYLKSQMRLLSLQEKGLKGRLFQGVSRRDEYRGIDLTTARSLLLSYLKDLDKARSTIREITFAKEQIKKDEAEWGSLAAIFPDPICQEMVRDIGKIKQTLRNERNVTERESERFEKKLSLMEDDLSRHISQTLEILKLEVERNEDKIGDLRVATLDLLGQEVALIETQIEDRIEERLSSLQKERALVDTQLVSIKKEMKGVPDSWLREHRIQYSADMNRGMLEALVQLVESKSIEQNLSFLESKPLDFAKSSLKPKRPLLKVFGGVGALLGMLFAFIGCFIYYFYHGFPLTHKNMLARGKTVLGAFQGKRTLETLRSFSLLLKMRHKNPLLACLVLDKGQDYAPLLAELLSKEGKKVLVMDLEFANSSRGESSSGLLKYLEGEIETPHKEKKSFGDRISMGGETQFGEELLKHPRFEKLLESLKKDYDVILVSIFAGLESTLPKVFFDWADVMALRLHDHTLESLTPYFSWEKEGRSLAFV